MVEKSCSDSYTQGRRDALETRMSITNELANSVFGERGKGRLQAEWHK